MGRSRQEAVRDWRRSWCPLPHNRRWCPWNGIQSVEIAVAGGEAEPYHYDGIKYLDWVASEDFQAILTAFSAPPEFAVCDGSKALALGLYATGQRRRTFGLSWRTLIGTDVSADAGYKLHIAWNCTASPAAKTNQTISDSPEMASQAWTINSVPPAATTYKPTAHLEIDSTLANATKLTNVENMLYGYASGNSFLPTQAAIIAALA
jgi:hypothetical protein